MTRRWKIFTILSCMYLLAYFYRVSMAVTARDLARDLGLSAVQLGTLSSVLFYAFAAAQLPLGPLLDRFGGRRIVVFTGIVTACGALLFALSPGYHTALAARILLGLGTASVLMGSLKVFTAWFTPFEFATVSGFIMGVGNIGNLCATAPLALSVSRMGWRWSFIVVAILQLFCTITTYFIVRDHPSSGHGDGRGVLHERIPPLEGMRRVFSTPSYWLLSLLAFFWYANYMALQGLWGGPYLMEILRLTREEAGKLLLLTSIGYFVGCLFIGRVSDRFFRSRKRTLLAGQALLLCFMSVMLGPAESLLLPVLALDFFLIGLAVSSGVAIYPMVRESFPHAITGTAMTCVNFFILMGAAVTQQVMGLYIGRFPRTLAGYPPQAYHGAFVIPVSGLFIAILLFLFVRETRPAAH